MATDMQMTQYAIHLPRPSNALVVYCNLLAMGWIAFLLRNCDLLAMDSAPLIVLLACVIFAILSILNWPGTLFERNGGISIGPNGFTANGTKVRWNDIASIDHSALFSSSNVVRIRLKRGRAPFWTFCRSFAEARGEVRIPACPVVFRELIPAILAARPDTFVSHKLQPFLEDPENAGQLRRRPATILLILLCSCFSLALQWYASHFIYAFLFSMLFVPFCAAMAELVAPLAHTPRDRFIKIAIQLPVCLIFAALLTFLCGAAFPAISTLATFGLSLCILALIILLFRITLARARQVAVGAILFICPLFAYQSAEKSLWPNHDISSLLPGETTSITWGSDGEYAAPFSFDDDTPPTIIHLPSLTAKPIPNHGKKNGLTVWLDRQRLIRRIYKEEKGYAFWVYEFAGDEEYSIPLKEYSSFSIQQCVSPDRRLFAWVQRVEMDDCGELILWDLEAKSLQEHAITLPETGHWSCRGTTWLDNKTLALESQVDGQFSILRIDLESGTTNQFTSQHPAKGWLTSRNLQYALGADYDEDHDPTAFYLLRIGDDTLHTLSPQGSFPLFAPNSSAAFRTATVSGKHMLIKIDLQTAEETPLFEINNNQSLVAVSPNGKHSLLLGKNLPPFFGYMQLVETLTGQKHPVRLPEPQLALDLLGTLRPPFWHSLPFSPNGRYFIVSSFCLSNGDTLRTRLCDMPQPADNEKTAAP